MTFPDVAGVALIDSATPYQFDLPDYPGFYSMWRRASAALPSLARLGLLRLLNTGGTLPRGRSARGEQLCVLPAGATGRPVEFGQLPTIFRQTKALKSLNGKPLRPHGRSRQSARFAPRAVKAREALNEQCPANRHWRYPRGTSRRFALRRCDEPSHR
jgi:hypothetical protein